MTRIQSDEMQDPPEDGGRPRYSGETIRPATGESYGWHSHGFGQLISAASGSMYVGTPDRVLLLSPAMAVWIPPDVDHWMRYGSNNEMLYVDVNRTESARLGGDCRIVAMTPLLAALISATMPENANGRADGHRQAIDDLLLHELVAAREVPLSVAMPEDRRIASVAQAALDDPGRIASVDEWLAAAPASRKTAERLFAAETGMPPSRWLRQVRILHAVSRLAAGEKVASVALDMGYESPSAFSYMFRQALGISPRGLVGPVAARNAGLDRDRRLLRLAATRTLRRNSGHSVKNLAG
ncbi:AraC family transcriptional regulator [Oceaniradius stylonematis]|jgi:AraC-like DNA-binding protein/quercetin dioxygenase-like cupin family protein|uniref:AraC family transcriptional regulator n=1 Tax=Oceaniradius stylonematis TaxID=2184161 RepID=A0A3A8AAW7_9HYPH|nr:helix-turn-helix transcriptional regulator [Oceaniradius stylonematis]RKF07447.1 AraC family transcriptional regulator [Oceaniradius stylonematis]